MGPWGGQGDARAASSLSSPCCVTAEMLLTLLLSRSLSNAGAVAVFIPDLLQGEADFNQGP